MTRVRRGVSLVELMICCVVLALLGFVLVPTVHSARVDMRGRGSDQNLRRIGVGASQYALDNKGRIFSFNWREGEQYAMPDGRFRTASSRVEAAAHQEQEILMRLTGRISGVHKFLNNTSQFAPRRMSHLVLLDYMGEAAGSPLFIDPADGAQFLWSITPTNYGAGSFVPYANGIPGQEYYYSSALTQTSVRQRWAFGSSYQVSTSAWNNDAVYDRVLPIESHPHLYSIGSGVDLSTGRFMHEVYSPRAKVWMFEEFDRERTTPAYFAYNYARVGKLLYDGSVNLRSTGQAELSGIPENFSPSDWRQTYQAFEHFPLPILTPGGNNLPVNTRWMWTTGGLRGLDYPLAVPSRGAEVKGFGQQP